MLACTFFIINFKVEQVIDLYATSDDLKKKIIKIFLSFNIDFLNVIWKRA